MTLCTLQCTPFLNTKLHNLSTPGTNNNNHPAPPSFVLGKKLKKTKQKIKSASYPDKALLFSLISNQNLTTPKDSKPTHVCNADIFFLESKEQQQ